MKKLITLLLTLSLIFTGAAEAFAAKRISVYAVNEALLFFEKSTGEITGFAGEPAWLAIPGTLAGYKVTSIGDRAFKGCKTLKSVVIPNTVNHIGTEAFSECSALINAAFDGVIENIPYDAFEGTPWAQGTQEGFAIAGGTLLYKYNGTETDVAVPAGVQKIAPSAFAWNSYITSVYLPDGIIELGENAFVHCGNLQYINFPASLSYVGTGALDGTAWLKNSGGDFVAANDILIAYNGGGGYISVPEGIVTLGGGAFRFNDRIEAVYLPESVLAVCDNAFGECASLRTVILSPDMVWIDDEAFAGSEGVSLLGRKGSYGEYFAQTHEMTFNEPVSVIIDGGKLGFDVPPVVLDGVTYAPVRTVLEALGLTVGWSGGTVTAEGGGDLLSFRVGESTVSINGREKNIDAQVINVGGRVMVPIRAFAELMGGSVKWDGENRAVVIDF